MNQTVMMEQLIETAVSDSRIVGLVDYGSAVEGRGDQWSDVDVALFIIADALPEFDANWKTWAAQFGDLLLAYKGGIGHPWCVYAAQPLPLRVDFNFIADNDIASMQTWPKSPTSVEAMVKYDPTGELAKIVQPMIGQSLGPEDAEAAFYTISGDFWYYILRTIGKIKRNQEWLARWEFNFILIGNLTALMRLESGQTERFRVSHAVDGIETAVSPQRLQQLNQLIPGQGMAEIIRAMEAAITLGYDVCQATSQKEGWAWPQELAEQIRIIDIQNI